MSIIDTSQTLGSLTVAEFLHLLESRGIGAAASSASSAEHRSSGRLVYGLRGIQELFGCSHKTAQYYKDHVIREAVSQNGRKIVTDADLALQIFNQRRAR